MLGLEILRDNHLTTEGWFLNEQAMREMNLSEDATSFMLDRHERPIAIAGIVRDFYCFGNVTTGMNPVMFRFLKDNEAPWMILIETQGDPFAAKEAIGKVYEKVTGLEFEAFFMDESLQNSFDSQIRLAKIVIVFSIIAILISVLGLLAMSTYFIQQRLQEVSVRKVFGSSNRQILVKLVFTFLNYVLIAFVAVSLVVSSIMIGIITYISVLERTKEIGILRAMGASKRNVSNVFNAETGIIGMLAGLIGVGATVLLNFPINSVLHHFMGTTEVSAVLPVGNAIALVILSVVLTLIGGLIPSRGASKQDPATALRTE